MDCIVVVIAFVLVSVVHDVSEIIDDAVVNINDFVVVKLLLLSMAFIKLMFLVLYQE